MIAALSLPGIQPAHGVFGATSCPGFDDPFAVPPPNCVSLGNNYTHTYNFVGVRSDIQTSFQQAVASYDQYTELSVKARDPADVVVMDNTYGKNNLVGWVNCPPEADEGGSGTTRWCYGQYLRFNLSYPSLFDTSDERRDISCHEFGHTVGLRHTTSSVSCMNDDESWGDNLVFNTTEQEEINNQYYPY